MICIFWWIFLFFKPRYLRSFRNSLLFQAFEKTAHNRLLKEMLTQIFSTPNLHPKSKPFFDHVFNFSIVDNRIWFRNYQVIALYFSANIVL